MLSGYGHLVCVTWLFRAGSLQLDPGPDAGEIVQNNARLFINTLNQLVVLEEKSIFLLARRFLWYDKW